MGAMETIIGIDNGLKGGIAFLSPKGLKTFRMPTYVHVRSRRRVDAPAFLDLLADEIGDSKSRVVIEKPAGSKNAAAARSMADSFARCETCFQIQRLPYEPIHARKWQTKMFAGEKVEQQNPFADVLEEEFNENTKDIALRVALRIWPDHNWIATKRSRVPHDGMIDAALIAEYARLTGYGK